MSDHRSGPASQQQHALLEVLHVVEALDALDGGAALGARAPEPEPDTIRQFAPQLADQGHGIGRRFHQNPGIPHYADAHAGRFVLEPGMCFTIEPMINVGKPGCLIDRRDGWTARTVDGKLSAQFEHTILMTESGPEVLTRTKNGPQPGHTF